MVTAMEGWFGADTSSCGKAERVYDIDAITPGVRQQLFNWAARSKDRRGFKLIISGVWESTVWYKTDRSHIPHLRGSWGNSSDFPKNSF